MVSKASEGLIVKTLLSVLYFVMIAVFVYLFIIHGFTSCFDYGSRWDIAEVTEFYIQFVFIAAWIMYKESSWIITIVIIALSSAFGGLITIAYILFQFYKLTSEESSEDPLYFVLVRRDKREQTWTFPAVAAKVIFFALGCLMIGVMIYTIIIDLTSSNPKGFAPCLLTYVTDIYVHAVILSIWVAYKESSWTSAFFWILSFMCFRSIAECAYVVRQLSNLSSKQPASLILFKDNDRDLMSSDPLLAARPDV